MNRQTKGQLNERTKVNEPSHPRTNPRTNETRCIVQPLTKPCQISVREHLPPRERFLKILLDALSVRSFHFDITHILVRSKRRLLAIKLTALNAHRLNSISISITVEVVPSHEKQWHLHRFTRGSIAKHKSQYRRRKRVVLLFETSAGLCRERATHKSTENKLPDRTTPTIAPQNISTHRN